MINILFGAGIEAEKFYSRIKDKLVFSYVMDNEKEGLFHDIKIIKPKYIDNAFIIVATNEKNYKSIRTQLLDLFGYKELIDFIPHFLYQKKIAVAYGNCHMDAVKLYLKKSKKFSNEYQFYPFPSIYELDQGSMSLIRSIFPKLDLIIHQSVREDNNLGKDKSSSNVLQYINNNCKVVSCPNLYGLPKCFFPQLDGLPKTIKYKNKDIITIGEKNIEKWVIKGCSKDDIERKILSGNTYNEREILEAWYVFKKKLIKREVDWDIKISDYILKNYKNKKLFNEPWHIKTELAKEIANRVLAFLGYEEKIDEILPLMDYHEVFIYPEVKKILELEFHEEYIREYSCNYQMDLKKYIELQYDLTSIYLEKEVSY